LEPQEDLSQVQLVEHLDVKQRHVDGRVAPQLIEELQGLVGLLIGNLILDQLGKEILSVVLMTIHRHLARVDLALAALTLQLELDRTHRKKFEERLAVDERRDELGELELNARLMQVRPLLLTACQ